MRKLNYLVPVMIGAPDYKYKKFIRLLTTLTSRSGGKEMDIFEFLILHMLQAVNDIHLIFAITFNEVDYPLVLVLKTLLSGTIRHKKENSAYVLVISSISGR